MIRSMAYLPCSHIVLNGPRTVGETWIQIIGGLPSSTGAIHPPAREDASSQLYQGCSLVPGSMKLQSTLHIPSELQQGHAPA